ncbi:hypothetical protein GCM10023169_10600 [Georgenia halophila]|uniref:Membrane protein YphA (DoxX/SURF4 family) n=1 Tax=Georgenia halophila TaxID=620889 RepID=A0ABP8KZP0_9MICO
MTTSDPNRRDEPTDGPDAASTKFGGPAEPTQEPEPAADAPAAEATPQQRPSWLTEPADEPADDDAAAGTTSSAPWSSTPAGAARPTADPGAEGTGNDPAGTSADDERTTTADRRQGFMGLRDEADIGQSGTPGGATGTGRSDATTTQTGPSHAAPIPPAPAATAAVPAAGAGHPPASTGAAASTPGGTTPSRSTPGSAASSDDAALRERWSSRQPDHSSDAALEGATQARPRSRAAAHWWSLLISLVLTPVAWYLVADGGARLTLGEESPWATGEIVPSALIELVAGLIVVAVLLLVARWSALGAIVMGAIVLLAGLAFVVLPSETATFLDPVTTWLEDFNAFGGNVAHHLLEDGPSGRIALYGLGLLMTGVVSGGARRSGRAEQRSREAYERRTVRNGDGGA